MNEQSIKLSVVAYYLSKYDMDAVNALGYSTRSSAINDISIRIGNGNNYLKLRRDEFDVLTGSHRRGYANRQPIRVVMDLHYQLKDIPFSDFTDIVLQLLNLQKSKDINNTIEFDRGLSEQEIESVINAKDLSSHISAHQSKQSVRVYNLQIIENLKKLYQYQCQICSYSAQEYGTHIVEAHHIIPFSETQNNDSNNIIILCPNHHRLIHSINPLFDRKKKIFIFPNGTELAININLHLD